MVAVAALWRGGQAGHEARAHRGQHPVERESGHVVALVHDHVTIVGDERVDGVASGQALDHRDVDQPVELALPAAEAADPAGIETEERGELGDPLIEQRAPVDENARRPGTARDEEGSEHRLARSRRSDEDPGVVREQAGGGLPLNGREIASEGALDLGAALAVVIQLERDAELAQQLSQVRQAAPRQGQRVALILGARDHAGRQMRGAPQPLPLVELRVLESCEALHLVDQCGGQARLVDEQARLQGRVNAIRERVGHSGQGSRPNRKCVSVIRRGDAANGHDAP